VAVTKSLRLTPGMILRMLADAILIQVALLSALALRLFALILLTDPATAPEIETYVRSYFSAYCNTAWPLTAVCLIVFYLNGFYTFGRYYQGRYKALVVTQAVSLSYLLFGFLSFFFAGSIQVPRDVLVLAWLLSVLLLVGARVWTIVWARVVHPEREAEARARRGGQRHVLVIGGAGYIGSALVPKLLAHGHHVRLLDILLFGEAPIKDFADHPHLDIIRGDFRHVENVAEAMRDVDAVIHLGAIVGDPACSLDEDLTIDINLSATRMVAELARRSGVERFIFASTCSVYGACDGVLDERSRVKPISLYGDTKLASERVLHNLANERFQPTILRFATIYGLSGRTRFDLVVNLLAAKARLDGEISIFGGDQWRPFVHVDDAATAILLTLEAPLELIGNQVFNVGSNEQNYTIRQIGEMVQQRVVEAKVTVSDNSGDRRNYRVDFSKLRNTLGFTPQWTVSRGIEQVLEAIANGEVVDYRDARYSNVKFLSEEGTSRLARNNWARQLIQELANQ